jgi:hypothetical protein
MKMLNTTTTTMQARSLKCGLLAPLALAGIGLVAAPHAQADSILLGQTTMVIGTESTVDSFTTSAAGTVTVNLQNLSWPMPLSALSFSATSADQVIWEGGGAINSEVASFDVGAAGTYFAHIMATAQGPLNIGLYSLLMTFSPSSSPVPLGASGWMLLTGMFALAGLARVARPFELMGTIET